MAYEQAIIKTIIEKKDIAALSIVLSKKQYLFTDEANIIIWDTIENYFNKFNIVPEYRMLEELLEANKQRDKLDTLESIKKAELLDNKATPLIELQLQEYAKRAVQNESSKLKNNLKLDGDEKVKENLAEHINTLSIILSNSSTKEAKQAMMYGESSIERFNRRLNTYKKQDSHYLGRFGVDNIDNVLGGFTKRDMINVAGFTNQGKSPFLRFLAYQAQMQGLNVLFVPLETSQEQTENFFYCLHANNYKHFQGQKPPRITNKTITHGRMTKREEDYLKLVVEDYNTNDNIGSMYVLQPDDSKYSMDTLMADIHRIHNSVMPIDVLVLDYISILKPSSTTRYIDTTAINQMHTRMRQEMLAFDGGAGFTYIGACQINRKGYKDMLADKEHLYDLTAIGDFNAIERDSTLLFSIARTMEDENNRVARIQCLKTRDDRKVPPFIINFDGETGYFHTAQQTMSDEAAIEELESLDID